MSTNMYDDILNEMNKYLVSDALKICKTIMTGNPTPTGRVAVPNPITIAVKIKCHFCSIMFATCQSSVIATSTRKTIA